MTCIYLRLSLPFELQTGLRFFGLKMLFTINKILKDTVSTEKYPLKL